VCGLIRLHEFILDDYLSNFKILVEGGGMCWQCLSRMPDETVALTDFFGEYPIYSISMKEACD